MQCRQSLHANLSDPSSPLVPVPGPGPGGATLVALAAGHVTQSGGTAVAVWFSFQNQHQLFAAHRAMVISVAKAPIAAHHVPRRRVARRAAARRAAPRGGRIPEVPIGIEDAVSSSPSGQCHSWVR